MTGDVGGDGAAIEAVVIVNGKFIIGNGVDHVVVNPAEIGAAGLPFDDSYGFHV